ncbi:MAG: cytochrome P460 family protein [Deltaproteobacteria bacterium]|nr:cytochrome P460 family protein [Deltaproteobacteria bacterium]
MIRVFTCAAAVVLAAGCLSEVDLEGLPSVDGYQDWTQTVSEGDVPPHGDDTRVIYANEVALSYTGAGEYPLGTAIVKEIIDQDGDLSYIAYMRRIDFEPDGGRLEGDYKDRIGGWLFTRSDDADSEEVQGVTCWSECHVQAPFAGTFFNYGALLEPEL